MAIITKPVGGILKGVPATITLNKSKLAELSSVSLDTYFSLTTNWNKIILSYKSSEGNQQEIVEFNATLSSPTGFFDVSLKARDLFEIQVIKIIDFDGDIFIIPRSELTTSDFDVDFGEIAPSNLSYTTPVTYTQNQQITNNVPTVTGTVTSYSISPALPTGLSINPTTGVISGTPTVVVAATSYTVTASNSGGSTTANINITVEAESTNENIITFDGRNSATYISFPEPGKVVRLLPAENLPGNGLGSYWSTQAITGDFTFTATVRAGVVGESVVQALFGLNITYPVGGYSLAAGGWGINFYDSGKIVQPWDAPSNSLPWTVGSSYNIEIKRVNGVVSYKVDNTTFTYTLSTSATVYVVGYLQVGSWEVTNASLVIPEVPVTGDPILWQSKPGYIIEADGGATATSERPNYGEYYRVFAPSSQWVTGDFTFEAEINNAWQSNDYIGFYDSDTNFTLTTGFNGNQVRYEQTTPASYVKPAGDTYTVKMQRIGYVLKFYVNDVEVCSVTQTNLSTVKVPFFTFTNSAKHIVSATIELPEAPAETYVIYNLDGYSTPATKTSIGGVSGGVSSSGQDVAVKSSTYSSTGDFDYQWKFNWSSAMDINHMFVGVTGNDIVTTSAFYPNLTCMYGTANNPDRVSIGHNGAGNVVYNLPILSGENTYRLKRVGSTITHYLNGSQVHSAPATSFTAYPTVRTMGNEVCSETLLLSAPAPATSDYFTYTYNPDNLTISSTGGVSGGPQNSLGVTSIEDSLVGDFSIQFKFNWDSFTQAQGNGGDNSTAVFLGIRSGLNNDGQITGISVSEFTSDGSNKNIRFWFSNNSNTLYTLPAGDHSFMLVKEGDYLKYYIDGVLRHELTSIGSYFQTYLPINYPTVRTKGFVACTESREVEFVTWNTAEKTGVGTVTTGANGLITRSDAGGGYNLNVLSNEIITGDGHVEFVVSADFVSVVFGLAEVNSSSGSFNNLLIGCYRTANPSVLEGVVTTGNLTVNYGNFLNIGTAQVGDIIKIERVGTTYSIKINNGSPYSVTINNTNPVKASISPYYSNTGVNNVTIAS